MTVTASRPYRKDWDAYREKVRAGNRARYKAVQILINRHRAEYDRLYAEEALLEGVVTKPKGLPDEATLVREIARLQDQLRQVRHPDDG